MSLFTAAGLLSVVAASPMPSSFDSYNFNNLEASTADGSPEATIIAVVSIIVGLFLVFAGYKMFRVALFIAGFFLGSNLAYFIMIQVEPSNGYGNRDLLLFLIPILAGLIIGCLAYALWRFGLSLIGFFGGAALAMLILSFGSNGIISSQIGRIIFVVVIGIICAVAIHFFEKPAIISATALLGSYTAFIGFDTFVKTGFYLTVQDLLYGGAQLSSVEYTASGGVIGMIIGVLVLAVVGIVVQFHTVGKDYRHREGY